MSERDGKETVEVRRDRRGWQRLEPTHCQRLRLVCMRVGAKRPNAGFVATLQTLPPDVSLRFLAGNWDKAGNLESLSLNPSIASNELRKRVAEVSVALGRRIARQPGGRQRGSGAVEVAL